MAARKPTRKPARVSLESVRRMALALPGVVEVDHWGRPSFRVGAAGSSKPKIFVTLWLDEARAVVMITPEQQEAWVESHPEVFIPVRGTWGIMGATFVELSRAGTPLVRAALRQAWEGKAPKSLVRNGSASGAARQSPRRSA